MRRRAAPRRPFVGPLILILLPAVPCAAGDWPMWRRDALRSADAPGPLPDHLSLRWLRRYPPLDPAFRNPRLRFDAGYEPVVGKKLLFLASSRDQSVRAIDTETGEERWCHLAGGPVRLAPAVAEDRVYFGSDDGLLYCLEAASGRRLWTFRAAPSRRKVVGSGRLISAWPVRGGPVIAGGKVFFAAGVWPFEGVFVYALDARTGEVVWVNDSSGSVYGDHPHGAEAFGGITPQGYLAVDGDRLIVPCGAALPATLDCRTGELLSFSLPRASRLPGGWFTAAARARRRGETVPGADPGAEEGGPLLDSAVNTDRHEDGMRSGPGTPGVRSLIRVGGRELRFEDGYPGVEGEVHSMVFADRKLFVVTREGGLYCFAEGSSGPEVHGERPAGPAGSSAEAEPGARGLAGRILEATGRRRGHAFVWGALGRLAEDLALASELRIAGAVPDRSRVDALRRRLDEAGLHGERVSYFPEDPLEAGFPPWVAELVVVDGGASWGADRERVVETAYRSLRPYGGTAAFVGSAEDLRALEKAAAEAALAGARVEREGELLLLVRPGALPGAADYTGGWVSKDERVRAPLGVLWFDDAVGHFKRSPQPLVARGVMVSYPKLWKGGAKSPYRLGAPVFTDVYTGRLFSSEELDSIRDSLPRLDVEAPQPAQYRARPIEGSAWKPQLPETGERTNPLTGLREKRSYPRSYGCDGGIDYGRIITMRSGTPAYYDKTLESGTISISGPRSGCTNSAIPACGVLSVPYFYEGCTCSYPLPCGLALVSMPEEHEQWASWGSASDEPLRGIRRLGINLGAPGDRMTRGGTLWLDEPSRGGASPLVDVRWEPPAAKPFYRHSLFIEGGRGFPWVAASGVKGLSTLTVRGLASGRFLVRLAFTEPDDVRPGERVFDVLLEGRKVIEGLDVVAEAGGRLRALVEEVGPVEVDGSLDVELAARAGTPLLSGVELVAEGLEPGIVPVLRERSVRQLARDGE